jgi:hypothetical protein
LLAFDWFASNAHCGSCNFSFSFSTVNISG